jgi:hypothetical protein
MPKVVVWRKSKKSTLIHKFPKKTGEIFDKGRMAAAPFSQ